VVGDPSYPATTLKVRISTFRPEVSQRPQGYGAGRRPTDEVEIARSGSFKRGKHVIAGDIRDWDRVQNGVSS
jgi:hypothetical protein